MDEVLHPVKSRRLIEGSAQDAYDFIQSVVDGPEHLHVVDNPEGAQAAAPSCWRVHLGDAIPGLGGAFGVETSSTRL